MSKPAIKAEGAAGRQLVLRWADAAPSAPTTSAAPVTKFKRQGIAVMREYYVDEPAQRVAATLSVPVRSSSAPPALVNRSNDQNLSPPGRSKPSQRASLPVGARIPTAAFKSASTAQGLQIVSPPPTPNKARLIGKLNERMQRSGTDGGGAASGTAIGATNDENQAPTAVRKFAMAAMVPSGSEAGKVYGGNMQHRAPLETACDTAIGAASAGAPSGTSFSGQDAGLAPKSTSKTGLNLLDALASTTIQPSIRRYGAAPSGILGRILAPPAAMTAAGSDPATATLGKTVAVARAVEHRSSGPGNRLTAVSPQVADVLAQVQKMIITATPAAEAPAATSTAGVVTVAIAAGPPVGTAAGATAAAAKAVSDGSCRKAAKDRSGSRKAGASVQAADENAPPTTKAVAASLSPSIVHPRARSAPPTMAEAGAPAPARATTSHHSHPAKLGEGRASATRGRQRKSNITTAAAAPVSAFSSIAMEIDAAGSSPVPGRLAAAATAAAEPIRVISAKTLPQTHHHAASTPAGEASAASSAAMSIGTDSAASTVGYLADNVQARSLQPMAGAVAQTHAPPPPPHPTAADLESVDMDIDGDSVTSTTHLGITADIQAELGIAAPAGAAPVLTTPPAAPKPASCTPASMLGDSTMEAVAEAVLGAVAAAAMKPAPQAPATGKAEPVPSPRQAAAGLGPGTPGWAPILEGSLLVSPAQDVAPSTGAEPKGNEQLVEAAAQAPDPRNIEAGVAAMSTAPAAAAIAAAAAAPPIPSPPKALPAAAAPDAPVAAAPTAGPFPWQARAASQTQVPSTASAAMQALDRAYFAPSAAGNTTIEGEVSISSPAKVVVPHLPPAAPIAVPPPPPALALLRMEAPLRIIIKVTDASCDTSDFEAYLAMTRGSSSDNSTYGLSPVTAAGAALTARMEAAAAAGQPVHQNQHQRQIRRATTPAPIRASSADGYVASTPSSRPVGVQPDVSLTQDDSDGEGDDDGVIEGQTERDELAADEDDEDDDAEDLAAASPRSAPLQDDEDEDENEEGENEENDDGVIRSHRLEACPSFDGIDEDELDDEEDEEAEAEDEDELAAEEEDEEDEDAAEAARIEIAAAVQKEKANRLLQIVLDQPREIGDGDGDDDEDEDEDEGEGDENEQGTAALPLSATNADDDANPDTNADAHAADHLEPVFEGIGYVDNDYGDGGYGGGDDYEQQQPVIEEEREEGNVAADIMANDDQLQLEEEREADDVEGQAALQPAKAGIEVASARYAAEGGAPPWSMLRSRLPAVLPIDRADHPDDYLLLEAITTVDSFESGASVVAQKQLQRVTASKPLTQIDFLPSFFWLQGRAGPGAAGPIDMVPAAASASHHDGNTIIHRHQMWSYKYPRLESAMEDGTGASTLQQLGRKPRKLVPAVEVAHSVMPSQSTAAAIVAATLQPYQQASGMQRSGGKAFGGSRGADVKTATTPSVRRVATAASAGWRASKATPVDDHSAAGRDLSFVSGGTGSSTNSQLHTPSGDADITAGDDGDDADDDYQADSPATLPARKKQKKAGKPGGGKKRAGPKSKASSSIAALSSSSAQAGLGTARTKLSRGYSNSTSSSKKKGKTKGRAALALNAKSFAAPTSVLAAARHTASAAAGLHPGYGHAQGRIIPPLGKSLSSAQDVSRRIILEFE